MSLSKEREAYLRKRMEDSAEWLVVIDNMMDAIPSLSTEEVNRLSRLKAAEVALYLALGRALIANQDTLTIL